MIKNFLRIIIGLIVATPFAILTYILSVFMSKQKAIKFLGPAATFFAKTGQQFFPPKIKDSSEFDKFKVKVKDKQKIWRILYDYQIEYPDENTVKLPVRNCPFADALKILKISEFGTYICQGDWEVAKDNSDKWKFERSCQIGTGGKICDFTYIRISKD